MTGNMTTLENTVSLDLNYFSNKFIDDKFITQTASNAVLSKLAISEDEKARQLLNRVKKNYETSLNKQEVHCYILLSSCLC